MTFDDDCTETMKKVAQTIADLATSQLKQYEVTLKANVERETAGTGDYKFTIGMYLKENSKISRAVFPKALTKLLEEIVSGVILFLFLSNPHCSFSNF
jgi:hypothetical protein